MGANFRADEEVLIGRETKAGASGVDVATLAGRVSARLPGVETLVRQPSGTIVAYHTVGNEQRASVIDPASGDAVADYRPSATQRWLLRSSVC